jgi:carbon-monoxide dehydrogenase large subunit
MDIHCNDQAYAVVIRSDVAHGILKGIQTSVARTMPGVLGVWTGADLKAVGRGPSRTLSVASDRHSAPIELPIGYSLATDKVRFVGDPVAVVIAESSVEARNAADTVGLDIEILSAVTESRASVRLDSPRIFDEVSANTCLNYYSGEYEDTIRAFDKAAHVTRLSFVGKRVVGPAMKPAGIVGRYDPLSDRVTLGPWSQGVRLIKSFNGEDALYSGCAGFVDAARLLGRPIKWVDDSPSSLLGGGGCAFDLDGELAMDKDGHFLAMRQIGFTNLGAYLTNTEPLVASIESCDLATLYRLPLIEVRRRMVFTNTPPLGTRAEPSRPEPNYVMERLIDAAAREMAISPLELRRCNLDRNSAFIALLDRAAETAAIESFARRKAESLRRGKLRGLGLGDYSEVTASLEQSTAPQAYRDGVHVAEVEIDPDTGSFDIAKYTMVSNLGLAVRFDEDSLPRCGEAIDKGALPAVMNALVDALGGKHVDAPATPHAVWQALNAPPAMLGLN